MSEPLDFRHQIKGQLVFSSAKEGEEVFHDRDLIQLFPYGLSFDGDPSRPVLLLKDKSHENTLPVVVNALEAGVTLTQNNRTQAPLTPHKFTQVLLETLDIQVVRCVFVEIRGLHQYVRMYFQGHPGTNSIKLRADEAMSLCLQLKVPIFATKSFIERSRDMKSDQKGLRIEQVQLSTLTSDKFHPYFM